MTKRLKIPVIGIVLSLLVLFVLLTVFMVVTPLMTTGTSIELPKQSVKVDRIDDIFVTVAVNGNDKFFLQGEAISLKDLVPKLLAIAGSDFEKRIYVRAPREANYGDVMNVMAKINAAGFSNVGLVTDPVKE